MYNKLERDRIRTGDCWATFCYSFPWATTSAIPFVDALLAGSCRKSSDYSLYTSTTTGGWWIPPPTHQLGLCVTHYSGQNLSWLLLTVVVQKLMIVRRRILKEEEKKPFMIEAERLRQLHKR